MQNDINAFRINFYNTYHSFLLPKISSFESIRKHKLIKALVISGILIVVGIIFGIMVILADDDKDIRLPIFLIGAGLVTYSTIKKNFENSIKDKIMSTVVKCFGNDMRWCQIYTEDRLFEEAGAIPCYERVEFDDVFQGLYKGVNIDIVESEYEKGHGKGRRTTFDGVVIKLDMNKSFNSHTIVCSDHLFHNSPLNSLKRTELEDVEFEKKYDVFTNDPVEARYLLSPAFMEKLKKVSIAFHCTNINCAFYKNNLIIALSTSADLFSIGSLVKPVADPKQFEELLNQFVSILALIDILELDKKTNYK